MANFVLCIEYLADGFSFLEPGNCLFRHSPTVAEGLDTLATNFCVASADRFLTTASSTCLLIRPELWIRGGNGNQRFDD